MIEIKVCKVYKGEVLNYYLCTEIWSRSSMDRMKDSGSFDVGSIPAETTKN